MSDFPFSNSWRAPRRMQFPPPFPEHGFPRHIFPGPPNHPPHFNFHPQYPVRYPAPDHQLMGFTRGLMPPPNMPIQGLPTVQDNIQQQIPMPPFHVSQCFPLVEPCETPLDQKEHFSQRELNLKAFLNSRRVPGKKSVKTAPSTVEFRIMWKKAKSLSRTLLDCKKELSLLTDCDENSWKTKMNKVRDLKNELNTLCSLLSSPETLSALKKRIELKARKRASKVLQRQELSLQKAQEQETLHWKIDHWLDEVKDKNLKIKRDLELKREADMILSEVRRKIHEAKQVNEFLGVLEKLRASRQDYATKIGLELSPDHEVKLTDTIVSIRSCFSNQLEQYEGEERALKVMLEAEQEECREEERRRQLETARNLLHHRQESMLRALFGPSDANLSSSESPLFLFYQHHNSANSSLDSLLQIRRQWDAFISEEGDPLPQQWVAPPGKGPFTNHITFSEEET